MARNCSPDLPSVHRSASQAAQLKGPFVPITASATAPSCGTMRYKAGKRLLMQTWASLVPNLKLHTWHMQAGSAHIYTYLMYVCKKKKKYARKERDMHEKTQ